MNLIRRLGSGKRVGPEKVVLMWYVSFHLFLNASRLMRVRYARRLHLEWESTRAMSGAQFLVGVLCKIVS